MRRPADASIEGGDDIVGSLLRLEVGALVDLPPPPATGPADLILVDNSEWLAGGGPQPRRDAGARGEERGR